MHHRHAHRRTHVRMHAHTHTHTQTYTVVMILPRCTTICTLDLLSWFTPYLCILLRDANNILRLLQHSHTMFSPSILSLYIVRFPLTLLSYKVTQCLLYVWRRYRKGRLEEMHHSQNENIKVLAWLADHDWHNWSTLHRRLYPKACDHPEDSVGYHKLGFHNFSILHMSKPSLVPCSIENDRFKALLFKATRGVSCEKNKTSPWDDVAYQCKSFGSVCPVAPPNTYRCRSYATIVWP